MDNANPSQPIYVYANNTALLAAHEGVMCKRVSFFRSLVLNDSGRHLRLKGERSLSRFVFFGALALAITAYASALLAADNIQQIRLGPHIFYIPKNWMNGARGPGRILVQNSSGAATDTPQAQPIAATTLDIWPGEDWQPYGSRELPEIIEIIYSAAGGRSPLEKQQERWAEQVASKRPNKDGFVRLEADLERPNQKRAWEWFLYEGYLNDMGQPLVVHSNNMRAPRGNPYLSDVTIRMQPDLILSYHFNNAKFPENTWWGLYQNVIAFVDYLQTPK